MKKKFALVLAVVCALSLTACSGNEPKTIGGNVENVKSQSSTSTETKNNQETVSTSDAGYKFVSKGVSVCVDADSAEVAAALGDPVNYFEAPSCAFDGIEKTYTYSGFEFSTYIDGKTDRIAVIVLTNDLVTTEEGIAIGDSASKLDMVYPAPTDKTDKAVTYEKGGSRLIFILDNGSIASIQYLSIAGN